MVAQIPGGPPTGPAGPANNSPADATTGEFCRTNSPLATQPQFSPVNPPYAGQPSYAGPAQGPPDGGRGAADGGRGQPSYAGLAQGPPGNPGPSFQGQASPAIELPPGSPPLELDGYCPVQLTDNERWVLGDRRWGAIHEGRTYLFAGPEDQNRFLADPTHYAPVFSGDDVVKLVDEGKRVPGSRLHGAWFHGKVYLFVSEGSYQQFDKNPFRYVSKLEAASSVANRPPAPGWANGGNLPYSNGVGAPPDAGRPPLR